MAYLIWSDGVFPYALTFPTSYVESERLPVAVYTSYGGYRLVDRRIEADAVRLAQIQWENVDDEFLMRQIVEAYRQLQYIEFGWEMQNPAGEVGLVRPNPDLPGVNVVQFAGPDGTTLYTVRVNVIFQVQLEFV